MYLCRIICTKYSSRRHLNVTQVIEYVFCRRANIVGMRENGGYQTVLAFPNFFPQKTSFFLLFSLAVFGESPSYCYSLGVIMVMQKLFCNISFITQDIYLKLGVCVHYPKSNPCYQGRQFKIHFFTELYSFFIFDFLSSIKHPTA